MKTLILLIVCLTSVNCMTPDELMHKFMDTAEKCKVIEGAPNFDLTFFMRNIPFENRHQKCITACIFEQLDLMHNGVLKKAEILDILTVPFKKFDPDITSKLMELTAHCDAIADPDRCEFMGKVYDCVETAIKKFWKE